MESLRAQYDATSKEIFVDDSERLGFASGYHIRRHRHEAEANCAIHEARRDWQRFIGPIDTFADANPYHGNFVSLVLPFTRPDRVRISAYFMEYAFLYDDICESANKALRMDPKSNGLILDQTESVAGAKRIQSKIIRDLFDADALCAKRIIDKWKLGLSTTRALKHKRPYRNLKEYIPFRSLDTGAPFVEAIMLFGMGVQLTEEDDMELKDIVAPAYAALGLANDYFSFDREYAEWKEKLASAFGADPEPMTNSVWLCMQWYGLDVQNAKEMIKRETNSYEAEYQARKQGFLQAAHRPQRQRSCLDGLSQMIIGNVVWSLACPRYHPERRYDSNAEVENLFLTTAEPVSVATVRAACAEKLQQLH